MKPNDPPPQRPAGADSPGQTPPSDPLDALRSRIRSTQDAVGRLADEANRMTDDAGGPAPEGGTGRPPPSGYAVRGAQRADESTRELQALVALVDVVRGLVPRELAEQLVELVRELLL